MKRASQSPNLYAIADHCQPLGVTMVKMWLGGIIQTSKIQHTIFSIKYSWKIAFVLTSIEHAASRMLYEQNVFTIVTFRKTVIKWDFIQDIL